MRQYKYQISKFLKDIFWKSSCQAVVREISTQLVKSVTFNYRANIVLLGRPPSIAEEERTLLINIYISLLNSYRSIVEVTIQNFWPAYITWPPKTYFIVLPRHNLTYLFTKSSYKQVRNNNFSYGQTSYWGIAFHPLQMKGEGCQGFIWYSWINSYWSSLDKVS